MALHRGDFAGLHDAAVEGDDDSRSTVGGTPTTTTTTTTCADDRGDSASTARAVDSATSASTTRSNDAGVSTNSRGGAIRSQYATVLVEFTYADESVCFSQCRHQQGCWNDVSQHAIGGKGRANLEGNIIYGPEGTWRYRERAKDPYQQEHDDLFAAIVQDKPFNEGFFGAEATLTAIMGRMSTYTGKEITWEQALNSTVDTMPKVLAFDAEPLVKPLENGLYPIPVPGDSLWASKVM